jgi:hypothetical protein
MAINDQLTPFDLPSLPPDVLHDVCDKLAHSLLQGGMPETNDPFCQIAEMILSQVLMDWALHSRAKEVVPHAPEALKHKR